VPLSTSTVDCLPTWRLLRFGLEEYNRLISDAVKAQSLLPYVDERLILPARENLGYL
jgi:hypothetical protein